MAAVTCAVIGAGIVGAAAAHALTKRGAQVRVFDQFPLFHDHGSSHGTTRLYRTAYFEHENYVPLAQLAVEAWRELEAESGEEILSPIGVIMAGPPDGAVISGMRTSAKAHGLNVRLLMEKELAEKAPWLHLPDSLVALFEQSAGFIFADRALRALCRGAADKGAVFNANEKVTSWRSTPAGVEIKTSSGATHVDRLIIAAGAWASDLLGPHVARITPVQKSLFWIAPNDKRFSHNAGTIPFGVETPEGRFFYGFPAIDETGVKFGEHTGGAVMADPLAIDPAAFDAAEREATAFLKDYLPDAPRRIVARKSCLYEMSPDGDFIIDRHPEDDRVAFAAGLSGHGFKFAPVLGEALADLALHGAITADFGFLLRRP